jgi:hypothetical protein
VWRDDERPKSVEDLFKDDPPLNLPIIKGLEEYIPQEDFFDEDLIKRVEAAHKDNKNKKQENKAARQIPKNRQNSTKLSKGLPLGQLGKPVLLKNRDSITKKKKDN